MATQPGSEALPLFPLPSVVLFPGGRVPLHVFEKRYREMTTDVLEGEQRMGMVAVRPECLGELAGDPPVFPVGCVGIVREARRRTDGRYDLQLVGAHRFRILDEPPRSATRLYRVAHVEPLEDPQEPGDAARLHALRTQVVELLAKLLRPRGGSAALERFDGIDEVTFVNILCQLLELPTAEKQGLLEASGATERCERLLVLLRFRLAELQGGLSGSPGTLH